MVCFLLERCHSRLVNGISTLWTGFAVTPSTASTKGKIRQQPRVKIRNLPDAY
jgi:hypothetical protein